MHSQYATPPLSEHVSVSVLLMTVPSLQTAPTLILSWPYSHGIASKKTSSSQPVTDSDNPKNSTRFFILFSRY